MKRKWIWLGAFIVCAATIFVFSSMDADSSSALSDSIAGDALPTLIVRKGAHVFIYAALGITSFKTICWWCGIRRRNAVLLSVLISSIYAVTDEVHQRFVPGRSGAWGDWALDTAGAIIGVTIILTAEKIMGLRKR